MEPVTAATEVHDAAGACEPGYHRGSANLGWKTCRCGEVPIPDAKPDTAARRPRCDFCGSRLTLAVIRRFWFWRRAAWVCYSCDGWA